MARADVPRYSRVPQRFWNDEKVRKWPDSVTNLALYLMTCAHHWLEGIFVLPPNYVVADRLWTLKKVKRAIAVLTKDGFLRYDPETNVMLLQNALEIQYPEGDNQIKGAIRRILDLPKTQLLNEYLELARIRCCCPGAPDSATRFYAELERALERASPQPSELLNLNLEPEPKSKSQSEPTLIAGRKNSRFLHMGENLEGKADKECCVWHKNGTHCLLPAKHRNGQFHCQWHDFQCMRGEKALDTFNEFGRWLKSRDHPYGTNKTPEQLWQLANSPSR